MSMHRKTFTLTEQRDGCVKAQVESGHLENNSERIRDLVRRDQQTKDRLAILRRALVEGESSGESKPLDLSAIKAAGRKRIKTADQCSAGRHPLTRNQTTSAMQSRRVAPDVAEKAGGA